MERKAFLGDVQQEVRLCAPLHCSYTIEPVAAFQKIPVERVLEAVRQKLDVRYSFIVNRSSPDQIIISFLDHTEAVAARRLAYEDIFLFIDGCRYRFWMDSSPYYSKKTTLDQRMLIKIKKLPLHMWNGRVVEQILSAFCIVDYVGPETETAEDPSMFTCTARLRHNVTLPPKIKVIFPSSFGVFVGKPTSPLNVHVYTVIITKSEYLPGITNAPHCELMDCACTSNIDVPKVYIATSPLIYELVQKYKSTVVLTVKRGSYYSRLANVYTAVENSCYLRVQIKILDDGVYLLSLCTAREDVDLYEMISSSFQDSVLADEISLCRWSLDYGSDNSTLGYLANLTITSIPCELCVPPIVEYILSSFALVQKHYTTVDKITAPATAEGNTIYRYRCAAWFGTLDDIPCKMQLALLPPHLANRREISKVIYAICSMLEISISVNDVLEVPTAI